MESVNTVHHSERQSGESGMREREDGRAGWGGVTEQAIDGVAGAAIRPWCNRVAEGSNSRHGLNELLAKPMERQRTAAP